MKQRIGLGMLLLACSACGGGKEKEEESHDISDQNLQGSVQGQAWAFVSGYADEGFEEGEVWVQLFATEPQGEDPCGPGAYPLEARSVGFTIVPEPQDREFSWDEPGVFSSYEEDTFYLDPILSGRLVIAEVTDTTISGSMVGSTPESDVDGHFSVPICPTE